MKEHLKQFIRTHYFTIIILMRICLFTYFFINFAILIFPAFRYGLFARYELVPPLPYPSTYIFTGMTYYLTGIVMSLIMMPPYRAFFVLAFSAFWQEYTWNITFLLKFPDSNYLPIHPLHVSWLLYLIGLGVMGGLILYIERKNLRLSPFLFSYLIVFAYYVGIGMPTTPHGVGFAPQSVPESLPIIFSLLFAVTTFKPNSLAEKTLNSPSSYPF